MLNRPEKSCETQKINLEARGLLNRWDEQTKSEIQGPQSHSTKPDDEGGGMCKTHSLSSYAWAVLTETLGPKPEVLTSILVGLSS